MCVATNVYTDTRSIVKLGVLALVARYHYPRASFDGVVHFGKNSATPPPPVFGPRGRGALASGALIAGVEGNDRVQVKIRLLTFSC